MINIDQHTHTHVELTSKHEVEVASDMTDMQTSRQVETR